MPQPTRKKAEETKARIISAAARLFSSQGFDKTSTRAIAAEAGVAHGTLFRYAPTKEDLVEAVFAERIGEALDRAEATAPADGAFSSLALHFYDAFVDTYAEDEALARVLVKELPFLQGDAQLRQNVLTFRLLSALSAHVDKSVARGDVAADTGPYVVASLSFGLYYAALVGWLSGQLDRGGAMELLKTQHLLLDRAWGLKRDAPDATPAPPTPSAEASLEPGGSHER